MQRVSKEGTQNHILTEMSITGISKVMDAIINSNILQTSDKILLLQKESSI